MAQSREEINIRFNLRLEMCKKKYNVQKYKYSAAEISF